MNDLLPSLVFEDEHLLVVNKPAGLNTHAASPFAGEGIYEFLRQREPRWANLAIIHRLDKETSGVLVFAKTPIASRSLTAQFTQHAIRKRYVLLTDRPVKSRRLNMVSALVRAGDRYVSRPLHAGAERAETRFRVMNAEEGLTRVEAEPVTGRTHQIRVHAAAHGFPILGDARYGGTSAERVCLHAEELVLRHPITQTDQRFSAPADFTEDVRFRLRFGLIDPVQTNAYRLIHGAGDGWPGWYVDRLGDYLLSQSEHVLSVEQRQALAEWLKLFGSRGAYHKILRRGAGQALREQNGPKWVLGEAVDNPFVIQENGLRYELSFQEGYSVGLFLDQRENRRRFLNHYVAAGFELFRGNHSGGEVLNAFAYTCGFSVCAARSGARVTSLDLSKKYLEWGKRNFALNGLDPQQHDFIFGDVWDWFPRLARKRRLFDVIVLDPPTFSQSKESGAFQVEKDYHRLVRAALPLLKADGVLFAATNAAQFAPQKFLDMVRTAFGKSGRPIAQEHDQPQPPDFPISRAEPAYLKSVWMRIGSTPRNSH